jgi:molybdopterin/thiamine biosynthesis adenylyltransferase
MNNRYDRQIRLFGQDGQDRLRTAHVALLGVGGLGMHLVQQLAYLGVRRFTLVDDDEVDETNLNRLVAAVADDIGALKIDVATRLIRAVQGDADVTSRPLTVPDPWLIAALTDSTVVVGAFDQETPRLAATDLCSAAGVPYIDVATEVLSTTTGPVYGGRVVAAGDGDGCVTCLDGVLDTMELVREGMTEEQRRAHDSIYGIDRGALAGSGPSVVTLNGVVASLAAMELMCLLTGLRPPTRVLTYRGDLGTVTRNRGVGRTDCPYCLRWRDARRRQGLAS